MTYVILYLTYSFIQAVLVCKYDSESDHSFGWTMMLWFFAPLVTFSIVAVAFYNGVVFLVRRPK